MIGRLAELLLRTNPLILKALRLTYSHVFLDEFQDTTHVQYDLVHTAFLDSNSILTAVGDNKQQIMRWAMALDNSFKKFQQDFGAAFIPLYRNYRSVPELVRIQHNIAVTLDNNSQPAKSMKVNTDNMEVCAIWNYVTPAREAEFIASYIKKIIDEEKLIPRDFGILVKQLAHEYEPHLESAFRKKGLKCRNEAGKSNEPGIQDILSERITKILLLFLRLGTMKHGGKIWRECSDLLMNINGYSFDDDKSGRVIDTNLQQFHMLLNTQMLGSIKVQKLITLIVKYIGIDKIKQSYPEYAQGEWLEIILELICEHLAHSFMMTGDWKAALDDFEGLDSVPIMTIHKSKGLEFNTVFLVGLDDSAWWSFKKQPEEARSTFFVAFSRAKQRIFFTYCPQRGVKQDIQSLYNVLQKAGVKSCTIK